MLVMNKPLHREWLHACIHWRTDEALCCSCVWHGPDGRMASREIAEQRGAVVLALPNFHCGLKSTRRELHGWRSGQIAVVGSCLIALSAQHFHLRFQRYKRSGLLVCERDS